MNFDSILKTVIPIVVLVFFPFLSTIARIKVSE